MKSMRIILALLTALPVASMASTCFLTLVKDSCWTDYQLTVDVLDASVSQSILSLSVPKGKSWSRQEFTCHAGQSFNYSATFSPVFWKTDTNKHFAGKRTWTLPQKMAEGSTAWSITVCYPEEFAEVPFPPMVAGKCQCDTQSIPPVVAPKKAS